MHLLLGTVGLFVVSIAPWETVDALRSEHNIGTG